MSGTTTLFCWVIDTPTDQIFRVEVGHDVVWGSVKGAIKEKKMNKFDDIAADTLKLWKVTISRSDRSCLKSEDFLKTVTATNPLDPIDSLSTEFNDPAPDDPINIIIVKRPTSKKRRRDSDEQDVERDRKRHPASSVSRKWSVNGSIRRTDRSLYYYLDPGRQTASVDCLDAVEKRQFVLLAGSRASGKSTRLLWLAEELKTKDYKAVYFSFERIDYRGDLSHFWRSIGLALEAGFGDWTPTVPIDSQQTFLDAFLRKDWNQDIVLLMDEFSELHSSSEEVLVNFIRTLREARNNATVYAIRSVIAAGTFSILRLNSSNPSPFNVSDSVNNTYFTATDTKKLFNEFEKDYGITIEDAVVDDIWARSNGHPGMICLCGRAVFSNLSFLLSHSLTLAYETWQRFPVTDLYLEISHYPTFRSMRDSLMQPSAEAALKLLRSHFAGYLESVELPENHENLADFLTTQGVLLRPNWTRRLYHMSSPLLDGYIRTSILPARFSRTPSVPPEFQKTANDTATLHVLSVLMESLKYFDKDTICLAASRSYKISSVKVGGISRAAVPRESVYDTELMGILSNWLQANHGWSVTGQWHLRAWSKHKYTDIVLKKNNHHTIVLELLATENRAFIQSHIDKTPEYMSLLSATEAWIIHFTCEDNFHPIWQSGANLDDGINMVHFSHNPDFTRVWMSARFKDAMANTTEINNVLLAGM